jgi:glycosyltransferase involved in cell wall biosynthesis
MDAEHKLVELARDRGRKDEAPVRVCMLAGLLDQVGGAEIQIARLAKGLAQLGAEVVICAHYKKGALQDDGAVRFIRVPTPVFLPRYVGGLTYFLATLLCLWRARGEYDLIHAHGLNAVAQVAVIAGGLLRKSVIAQAHGAGGTGDIAQLCGSWMQGLRRRLLMKGDRYIVVSDEIRLEMRGYGVDDRRIVSLPNGVDLDVFQPFPGDRQTLRGQLGLSVEDKVVTFVGRLHPIKRVDLLILAFRRIRASVPKVRLVIVGDGPLRCELERVGVTLGLGGDVVFAGSRPNVVPYLQASDLFVLPSEVEGMSVALLEAMACGVPVLVSDCDGNRDLVTEGVDGSLFPRGSEECLAQKMRMLLLNTAYAQRLARKAIEKIESDFCLESVAARYLELYRTVLSRNSVMVEKASTSRC